MPTKTLMTASEFAKTGPETDGFELVRGELVPMPPPKMRHGEVCLNVAVLLKAYIKSRGKGTVIATTPVSSRKKTPTPYAASISR